MTNINFQNIIETLQNKLAERVAKLDEIENDPNYPHYTHYLLGYRRAGVKFVAEDLSIISGLPADELIAEARKRGKS